ncbi:sensor histidine kinase [Cohnella silvisoli]|uniref:Histidine kinase n=1 Tax=Cohnella silvisoli TaxID=2873699 RepID=A0ABV1L0D7_9BACL|nr:histidine kinase [Cohnella silvisoli]MCD9024797.1 histidine kinase [Cohnella silvisoli]
MLKSIRSRIILLILAVNVSLTVILTFVTLRYNHIKTEHSDERYIGQITKDTMEALEINNKKYSQISTQLMINKTIQAYIPAINEILQNNNNNISDARLTEYKAEMVSLLNGYYDSSTEIDSIRIWFGHRQAVLVGQGAPQNERQYEEQEGYIAVKKKTPLLVWVANSDGSISQWQIMKNFNISKVTRLNTSSSAPMIGAIEIRLNPERLSSVTKKLNVAPNVNFAYTTSDLKPLFLFPATPWLDAYADLLQTQALDKDVSQLETKDHIFFVEKSLAGSYLITMYTRTSLAKYMLETGKSIVIVPILTLIISILCVMYIFRLLTRLFSPVLRGINKLSAGAFHTRIPLSGAREIDEISSCLNRMAVQIGDLFQKMHEAKQLEGQIIQEKNQAEIKALYNQINPHFLFNTLQSINSVAIRQTGGETEINDMIIHLSRLLRESIYRISNFVTLESELNLLWSYVHLQQIRYDDLFQVKWQIDYHSLNKLVPNLILQPIMENAIKHGVFNSGKERVLITVTSAWKDGELQISIADDGSGMEEAQLQEIEDKLQGASSQPGDSSGVGLYNTHLRMLHRFGNDYRMEIRSRVEEGTEVALHIHYSPESADAIEQTPRER